MNRFMRGLQGLSLIMVIPFSYASPMSAEKFDDSVLASTVLCQNLPAIANAEEGKSVYLKYLDSVDQLFTNRAKTIKTSIMGPTRDEQVLYELAKPISIVGMEFDTLSITDLKDDSYIYYQVSAIKPFFGSDQSFIQNIPQNDKITVSTKSQRLKISCNIRVKK